MDGKVKAAMAVPAVLAALLLGAVAPAVADATEFTAAEYPATITGTGGSEVFTAEGGTVSCESIGYHGDLNEASEELSLAPSYADCKAFSFVGSTVSPEECEYLLHLEGEAITADIACPEGQAIKIAAGTCSVEIKPQTGLSSITVANGESDLQLTPEIEGIAYTVTNDGFLCPFGGTGEKEDGTLTASEPITLKADHLDQQYTSISFDVG
ncbi:MAG: hypothetical protein R2725_01095 [Solirubrobacterales bacterium]